jgi:acetylornithine deacetylase/succinyl-diaminopimelate desuccinylase-like protein
MKLEKLIERALAIQSIPAPTFSEGARAAWVRREFDNIRSDIAEQDPIGNVYFRIPGGNAPPVVVTAHLDTVFSMDVSLSCHRTSERIAGPGIGDNSIGVASLLELASDFLDTQPPGDIWLIGNVGEEGLGNLVGMRHIISKFGDQASAYIVIEGMALGHIYHKGLPVRRYQISADGPGGHAWVHNQRPSALHVLIDVGRKLVELELPRSPKTSMNIGILHGGTTINSIARNAFLGLDLRSEDQAIVEDIVSRIEKIVRGNDVDGITLNIKNIGDRPGGGIPDDHPLVMAAIDSLKGVGISQIMLEAGSTDASAAFSEGYPAVCVGLTRGGDAHSLDEFIEIVPITSGYKSVFNLIQMAFQLEK